MDLELTRIVCELIATTAFVCIDLALHKWRRFETSCCDSGIDAVERPVVQVFIVLIDRRFFAGIHERFCSLDRKLKDILQRASCLQPFIRARFIVVPLCFVFSVPRESVRRVRRRWRQRDQLRFALPCPINSPGLTPA